MGLEDFEDTSNPIIELRKKAGDWDFMLSDQFNKIAMGKPYNHRMTENALMQLEMFYPKEVSRFYKQIYQELLNGRP